VYQRVARVEILECNRDGRKDRRGIKINKEEPVYSIEDLLNECCRMRGNPLELIHRTIHEFGWFTDELIFHKETLIKEITEWEPRIPTEHKIFALIRDFIYPDNCLQGLVNIFYEYCKTIYEEFGDDHD
jgi:hypothetical protein